MKLIGVTPSTSDKDASYKLNKQYCDAIEKAGAIPLILNYGDITSIDHILKVLDGIMLTGGVDVDPVYFGKHPGLRLGEVSPVRDRFEIALVRAAFEQDIKVLGICRGVQIMNIAFGGEVYQDIYSEINDARLINHSMDAPKSYPSHSVTIAGNSKLFGIFGSSEIRVNSTHHQAVSVLSGCFEKTAESPDGIIEAIECPNKRFFLGVQWHPEALYEEYPGHFRIFKTFVEL